MELDFHDDEKHVADKNTQLKREHDQCCEDQTGRREHLITMETGQVSQMLS